MGDTHIQNCGHQVADIHENEHQVHVWKENNILRVLNCRHPITMTWKAVPCTLTYILWTSVKMGFICCNERVNYKFILWKSNSPCVQEVLLGGGRSELYGCISSWISSIWRHEEGNERKNFAKPYMRFESSCEGFRQNFRYQRVMVGVMLCKEL